VAFAHEKEGIKTSLVGVSILNMINTVVYKKKELVKCVIFVHKACLVGLGLNFLYQYKNINFGIHGMHVKRLRVCLPKFFLNLSSPKQDK
jgi:hypothetical protein